jgi:tetratricopeptide (TPR) repeat protein
MLLGLCRRRLLWAAGIILGLVATALVLAGPQLRAWYHFRAARSELQRYHTPQALRHLQVCEQAWPDDPKILLLAARAARRALRYAEAEALLIKYQKVRGLDDAGGFEQLLLSAERNVDRVAGACWRYVGEDHPDTPLIFEALIRGYFRQYQLPAARMSLDRWLKAQPDNPHAHYMDGQFHLEFEHDESAALASYRRAVELDPEHEEARICLAVGLMETHNDRDTAEAVEHLEYVRKRQPDNLSVLIGLATCHDTLGHKAEAVQLADQVLAQQPDYPPALALRGRVAFDQGQFAEAETWLRQALSGNPANQEARHCLVMCLLQNGKESEARQHEKQFKQMQQDLARYEEIVGRDLLEKPHDPALHCELGQLLLRVGRREEGLRWLKSALREDPQYAPAHKALAEYSEKTQTKQGE